MDLELEGRVAAITGGSEGIGLATAHRLAREGVRVAICARRKDVLEEAATAVRAVAAGEVLAVVADVAARGEPERFVEETLARFGRLDVLVNNAGREAIGAFEAADDDAWQADLELKLFAAIRCTRLCLPAMRRAGGGRIVNILNTAAKAPPARSVPTSVSRAGGLALTKALSKELAPDNILVNAVCIGLVKSGQWERRWEREGRPGTLDEFYARVARELGVPLGRIAEASELAALVAFLASSQAAYVTGVAINFDGGLVDIV